MAGEALAAEEQIGGDVEPRHEIELLRDHHDARRMRLARLGEPHGLAGERIVPWSGVITPDSDAHQRALAGAVLAEQDVDLAGQEVEIDAAQRVHAAEPLLDPGNDLEEARAAR